MVSIYKIFKAKMTSKGKPSSSSTDNDGSSSDLSTAAELPLTIADLISCREWSLLESHLRSDDDALFIDDAAMAEYAITEDIIVHFAVRFQAPLRIVSLLSEFYPSSISSPDASGRYPIHVACKWSATPDVVKFLVQSNSSACGVQDHFGKTPIHYVAKFYPVNYQASLDRLYLYPMDDSMMVVVKLLTSVAPTSASLEDYDGCNAIDYALENHVNVKVIKSMRRACRDGWTDGTVYIADPEAEHLNPTTAAARSA